MTGGADQVDPQIEDLEQRVAERTRELREANAALERENAQLRRAYDEKKRAVEASRESEREAWQIVNSIPAGVGVLEPNGELQSVNDHILRYFGKSEAELKRWVTSDLVHAEDVARVVETMTRAIERGEPYDSELRLLGSDGAYRWFQVRSFPLRDEAGRILRWYALHIDIDERRCAEEALRENEVKLLKIINTLPTTAWSTRPDGYCDFLSHRWLDYAGFTAEQAVGWGWGAVIHPDDAQGLVEYWQGCLASGTPVVTEARMRRHDGVYRWFLFLANPLRDETGTIIKWYGTNIDIEDRKRADALVRSELQSRLIVSTIPGLVALFAPDGTIDGANEQFLEYLGQSFEEAKHWASNGTIYSDDLPTSIEIFSSSLASGLPFDFEARLRRFDGEYLWFQIRANPARDADGRIVRWYGLLTDIDARKRAEERLRASEMSLHKIINALPTTAWSTRPDGHCDFLSHRWLDYAGFSSEQAEGWGWENVIHPDDLHGLNAYWKTCLASGTPVDAEARMRRHDGEYRWFLFRANPLRDETGTIIKWYGTNIDIEDRKRADALVRSELQSRLIVSTIPGLVVLFSPDGAIDGANEQFLEYLGQSFEEAKDWASNGTAHPDDLRASIAIFSSSLASGDSFDFEARLRRFDGVYRWFQIRANPARDADGRIVRWYGLLTDIDARKRAEEALQANEVTLLKIINTLPTTAWSTRPDGYCDFLSHRWLDYAGFTAEQAVGWGWGSVIHPDDAQRLVEYWQACLGSGMSVDIEARMRRHDGVYRWFLFRANPLRDETGTIIKWYGANIDIEDRKRAEEALSELHTDLAHKSRISSLGVLTASVAHEVSQPLSGIITNANTCLRMLAASPPNVEGALETARRTIRDGTRASEVVGRLRALFSKKTEKSEAVDLNEATSEVIALASRDLQRNRVVLRTDFGRELVRLTADRVQLQQVILNLLLNANDAMSDVDDRQRLLVIRTAADGEGVRLSVQDAGMGFAAEDAERLFQAFYTTKNSGMGIGLSVSRSIIERHNGRLWGEPNDGPGATFSFTIPVKEQEMVRA
jgi:PAS domain S-box-containing protein